MVITLFLMGSLAALSPVASTMKSDNQSRNIDNSFSTADSMMNVSIPYVDNHYGSSDGIIDPHEYAVSYTDPVSGVTAYFEHNSTMLFVGLQAKTPGWIGMAWQNYTGSFTSSGLNGSDVLVGYVPGQTNTGYWRVVPTDVVSVHYILTLRNGTVLQEADYPDDTMTTPVGELSVIPMYREEILGMRLGEVRHFIIPAAQAYNDTTSPLYGQDLEYAITLTRIVRNSVERTANPADSSALVYSDEHGTSTFQHVADTDQSRIAEANGSDNGTYTQVEYTLYLNSTDNQDIPLLLNTTMSYPFIFMYGNTEELNGAPSAHTYWSNPVRVEIIPNSPPTLISVSPTDGSVLEWVSEIKLNATNDFVRRASFRIDDFGWQSLTYNFLTGLWEKPSDQDLSTFADGPHILTFNATDPSNSTGILYIHFSIEKPFEPLLGMNLQVARQVIVTASYGTYIQDAFTISNNGSVPFSSLEVYLPDKYETHFLSISASDADNNAFRIVRLADNNSLMHWRIHFSKQVGFQESYSFTLTTYMHTLFWVTDPYSFQYRINFLKFPVLPYVMKRVSFTLGFEDSSSSVLPGETAPDATATNVAPFTEVYFTSNLRLYSENILVTRTTKIVVDAWGWLTYTETIHLENTGSKAVTDLTYTVPAYATSIKIYDDVGILAFSQKTVTGDFNSTNAVTIHLASDRFGDNGFANGFKYTFHIFYVIQASAYQEPAAKGIALNVPIGKLGDNLILTHTIDIVFPISVTGVSSNQTYRQIYGAFDSIYRYVYYNQTERDLPNIAVVYQNTIGAAARPMLFTIIIAFIAVLYVSYRKVEIPEEVIGPKIEDEYAESISRQSGAPPELLRDFADLYSKKTSLNMDLEKLQDGRRKGKVKKREYMKREKDIKTQIEDIDSKLPSVKEELIPYGTRYRDLVSQLELQEEKINGAKAGLRQLLQRKKKQRISRVAFEKSRQDYLKTIQKATSATDRILLSIQEEAGDI